MKKRLDTYYQVETGFHAGHIENLLMCYCPAFESQEH